MIPQAYSTAERPDPIAERVGLGMFTDREREMAELMEWVNRQKNLSHHHKPIKE